MPLYGYSCKSCKAEIDRVQSIGAEAPDCPDCGTKMVRGPGSLSYVRVKGMGLPARRKWMDNWTPDSPAFSTGSLHGERY